MLEIYIDGSCLGNPGKMGVGYLIYRDKELVKKESISLGEGTNNSAEYMAFIFAMCEALSLRGEDVCVYSDSTLLCEQLKGNYKVKNKNILSLYVLARQCILKVSSFSIKHIQREKNKAADALARKAVGVSF